MEKELTQIFEGLIVEEDCSLTLRQVCRICTVNSEHILELVDEGILEPTGTTIEQYRFRVDSLQRVRMSCRLQQDLGINLAGVALALDLLEEIEQLRNRLISGNRQR